MRSEWRHTEFTGLQAANIHCDNCECLSKSLLMALTATDTLPTASRQNTFGKTKPSDYSSQQKLH